MSRLRQRQKPFQRPGSPRVAALLAIGNAVDGASVINSMAVIVCHLRRSRELAPSWVGHRGAGGDPPPADVCRRLHLRVDHRPVRLRGAKAITI